LNLKKINFIVGFLSYFIESQIKYDFTLVVIDIVERYAPMVGWYQLGCGQGKIDLHTE